MLPRRSGPFRAFALGAFVSVALVLFNLGSWFFYGRARAALEEEVRSRITLAARLIAHRIETSPVFRLESYRLYEYEPNGTMYDKVHSLLQEWSAIDLDIAGVFLMDLEGRVLVSTTDEAIVGIPYPFLELDRSEVEAAGTGSFVSTSPKSRESLFFMNSYGPVKIGEGIEIPEFILGVKADSRYERTFIQIRNGILVANLVSGLMVIGLALLVYRAGRRIAAEEETLFEREKLATLGQLAAGLAHEIRNPLGVIQQVAALFRRKAEFEGAEDSLEYLDDAIQRINRQVEDVLAYTRRDVGEKRQGDLGKTIERALAVLEFKIRKNGVTVIREYQAADPILFDPDRMEQVALNLILNALEAMPEGGTLTVKTRSLPEGVGVIFEDTGTGIDSAIRERMFEPFESTKEQGTGLGLAIVQRIVQNHGGDITVESTPGKGSRFIIRLPSNG